MPLSIYVLLLLITSTMTYYFTLRKRKDRHDWTCLPDLVWCSILEKLSHNDVIRFGAVCKQWYLQKQDYMDMKKNYHSHKALPLFMLISKDTGTAGFYCIVEEKFIDVTFQFSFDRYGPEFCGSCYGWLAFFNEENRVISLVKPFKTGRIIHLPPLVGVEINIPHFKVILSADPDECPEDGYIVVVMSVGGRTLTYIKAGGEQESAAAWASITVRLFNDIIFYKGLVFAVTFIGTLVCIDFHDDPVIVRPMVKDLQRGVRFHLVESSKRDLLLIQSSHIAWITPDFKVYKLVIDVDGQSASLIELDSLEDDTLFVGRHHSICAPHIDFTTTQFFYPEPDSEQMASYHAFNIKDRTNGYCPYPLDTFEGAGSPIIWFVPPFSFHKYKVAG